MVAEVKKYRPVLMVEPGSMKEKDIRRVERLGGIVIVECANPDAMRFADPPADANMDAQARAAMSLLRYMTTKNTTDTITHGLAIKFWVQWLINGGRPADQVVPNAKKAKP